MYDGDNFNFLSVSSFYTIKMLAPDLTVAPVVKVKSQNVWHCQNLRAGCLGIEWLGEFTGLGRMTALTPHRSLWGKLFQSLSAL